GQVEGNSVYIIRTKTVVVRGAVVRIRVDAEDSRSGILSEHKIVPPMHVRRGSGGGFREDRIVVKQHACGAVRHPRRSAGRMIGNVAYPIDRSSNGGLIAERMRSRIDHHVSHHTNVVHTAVDLEV